MNKEEILEKIKDAQPVKGHNSMGVSESWYNCYYMVGRCFSEEELSNMTVTNLESLIKLAQFASDVFY